MKKLQAQVALITVMIIATVLTVLLSVSFQSIVDTQVTELEEENQKALAAAEAAIEASIKENGPIVLNQAGSPVNIEGFTGGADITTIADNVFTTGKLEKNNTYTFYLSNYDADNKTLGATSTNESVTLCFQSASTQPALEISLIKTDRIKRYVVDPSSRITSAAAPSGTCTGDTSFTHAYTIPSADIGVNSQLMIVKVLYNSSKLVFYRTTNFPLQGKAATSEVKSDTGVSKKLYLFQTYPQIPADFLDTSF